MSGTWLQVLQRTCPVGHADILAGVADAMPTMIKRANLSNGLIQACFIGQCAEESDGFKTLREYASGREYEGRRDLGNIYPGDGVRYKGRGIIETTGRANYAACSKFFAVDFVTHPELLEVFPYAAHSAAFYWDTHRCNSPAAQGDVTRVTELVNGGHNGLSMRKAYTNAARAQIRLVLGY
jgi:putative chitinase